VQTLDCGGVDGFSSVFMAGSVSPASSTPASTGIYRPKRFVF